MSFLKELISYSRIILSCLFFEYFLLSLVKISDILNEYVAPAVEGDGGKISLLEYDEENKIARMLLQGACSGCPSSTATLKGGIENVLKQFVPELVEKVEAVNG